MTDWGRLIVAGDEQSGDRIPVFALSLPLPKVGELFAGEIVHWRFRFDPQVVGSLEQALGRPLAPTWPFEAVGLHVQRSPSDTLQADGRVEIFHARGLLGIGGNAEHDVALCVAFTEESLRCARFRRRTLGLLPCPRLSCPPWETIGAGSRVLSLRVGESVQSILDECRFVGGGHVVENATPPGVTVH